jgi:hypothetical protein
MLPLTKGSLATAAKTHRQTYLGEHVPADTAWDPYFVFQYFCFIGAFSVERANVGFVPSNHNKAPTKMFDPPIPLATIAVSFI